MPNKLASAYARLKALLPGGLMVKPGSYGTVCPSCKKSIVLGQVELRANAQLSDLRSAVLKKGWQGESVTCPRCEAVALCGPNDLIFVK